MEKEIIKKAIDQLHVGQVIDEAFKRVLKICENKKKRGLENFLKS